ncbi:hypothetical protein O6H91_05G079100 [Diphasiastrum complanatum]|uniref:Uncharacterized protein n=7 Tax=Diphasiastrum complanatum TaxID=34168 RepID=A0ACC2DQF0_DIPCM|nr:hypothetical protein O6H91_Y221500 [Diphasiastrum complanatum]KAJ7294960.1 hypothetical protein O6H91_Y221500 [Diphasiastrum complanatum]KAJ7294961.1 hypothetical protein O6H91_Y221500 [Diphasiastrum complanatum]KAJ7294962.1 hypothetical protein O6H91_Y221500 [Diphasiastrum complanatum]KAJ7294963.1 hypothetical protein O6H91_Y221500 [Diphasiastrum complanatum]
MFQSHSKIEEYIASAWKEFLLGGKGLVTSDNRRPSSFWAWLHLLLLEPIPQYCLIATIHFSFILCILVLTLVKIRSSRQLKAVAQNGGEHLMKKTLQVGRLYKITLALIAIMFLCHVASLLWKVVLVVAGWSRAPVQEIVFTTSQAFAWASFLAIVAQEKKSGAVMHSSVLRVWWVTTFFLSLLALITVIFTIVNSYPHNLNPWIDPLVSFATFPVLGFLAVVAVVGKTGIKFESADLTDPLLYKHQNYDNLDDEQTTAYYKAGFLSKASFLWLNPLLKKGVQKPLELSDVPWLGHEDRAEKVYDKVSAIYSNQPEPRTLLPALLKVYWLQLAFTAFLSLAKLSVMYVGPILISQFVSFAAGKQLFPSEGIVLVVVLFLAKCVEVLSSHHYNFYSQKLGMVVRSSLITTVYRKGLVLSSYARQSHGAGQIVNYMSVDVQQIADSVIQIHYSWVLPLQAAVALVILYTAVGVSCFAGIATMLFILAVCFTFANLQKTFQNMIMLFKDKRMAIITEVLNNMKIIKLQAWEESFRNKIEEIRDSERSWLQKFMYLFAVNVFLLWQAPLAVSTATFACAVILKAELTPGGVFTAISTFRIMQEPLRMFPQALMAISQAMTSFDRLDRYMRSPELDPSAIERLPWGNELAVEVEEGVFKWDTESDSPTLRNINLKVPTGSLVAIVGMVGSGKSALLVSLLGEIPKNSGKVKVSGSTAYVAQSSWIQNATIQQNILFGKPLDPVKYKETLQVCALQQDLSQMPFGDKTEIGERGINLSGGQKQRIQLARAVYQDADIYMLDDVFSAVDAHTGSQLFKECVRGALSKKTVFLVTHQVEFLHGADLILVMRDGEIVQSGTYDQLLKAGLDFGALVAAHNESMELVDEGQYVQNPLERDLENMLELSRSPSSFTRENGLDRQNTGRFGPERLSSKKSQDDVNLIRQLSKQLSKQGKAELFDDEERAMGKVSPAVYWLYATKAFHGFHVIVLLVFQTCWQGLQIASDYFLASSTSNQTNFQPTHFILVYAALAFGSGAFVLLRSLLVAFAGLITSQSFFVTFLRSIIRAPMAFLDTTPSGRILSRFATDQTNVDVLVPTFAGVVLATAFQSLGVLVVVVRITWQMILIILPLAWVYVRYQNYFISSSRELTRLDNITKAPIIHHFSETIAGFTTIRCFQSQERFKQENLEKVNFNFRMDFHNNAANEWLGFRLEMIGTVVLTMSALFMVTIGRSLIPSDLVGLSLSYGLALNTCLYGVVYLSCQLENRMVSVERINQYSNIPSEAPAIIENSRPAEDWPQKGNIHVQNLQLRYRPETPLVLKGISVHIRGGEKVGVVGRTGSGKSTLTLALFRLVEPSGGRILVDNVDITKLGLRDLRSRLCIIPQEPTMFEGTVRSNIDPLGEHLDAEIWESLEKSQLADIVRQKEGHLDSPVLDGGENWSVGQRQLFCLGRALLKRSRILVLDEATASVDGQTDAIMQKTIREEFSVSTVISIAHRIPSVMDSDKVLVLDAGYVKEFDAPSRLLERSTSLFASLVREYSARAETS